MSSSAIGFTTITYGPTGPTGNIGNRGLIGPDGATSGATGPRGSLAPHVANVTFYSAGATVVMSDGSLFSAIGSFGGATSTDYAKVQTVDYLNPLVDSTTYSFISSGEGTSSFIMRGISASGSLVVTEDAQAIYIDSIYTPLSGAVDAASLTDNTLVYLKERNQISSTTIGVTYGIFYDGALNFEKSASTPSFSKLLPRAKVKYVQPNYKTGTPSPVTLNVNDAGVFYIRTPNGISAFSGNFKNSEVVSFTLITESDDIWNFPTNVYFETGENYLTCGKSILNLTSFDQGNSWYATVAARGVDGTTFNCDVRSLVGSCCYTGLTGTNCRDFVTRNECDAIAGTFHPLQSCVQTCGATSGVCCSNGKCLDNVSYAECAAFGGKYFFGIDCTEFGASQDPNASNATRLCYDRCKEPVACCKDGICLGDEFTSIECRQILGGTPFPGKRCSEVDCCVQNVKVGACCVGTQCSQATLVQCREVNGVFLGEGEQCGSVNCGCFPDAGVPLGSCCQCTTSQTGTPSFVCVVTTQASCPNPETWVEDPDLRPGDGCSSVNFARCANLAAQYNCVEEQGKCCYCVEGIETSCTVTTRAACFALTGRNDTFTPGEICATPCDPCQIPCGDCYTPTPGVKCVCATTANGGVRQCENVVDINNPASGCNDPGVICVGNTQCIQSPCVPVLPDCSESNCLVPPVSESVECPGTSDISTGSTCTDCFAGGIIPDGSGSINYSRTHRVRIPDESDATIPPIFNDATNVYSEISTPDLYTPECPGVQPNANARQTPVYGYSVKDYYIPIKEEYKCGNDLQFCIELDLPQSQNQLVNSIRAYVLRTWYPKYFSTNMAAYQGLTLSANQSVQFFNPSIDAEEFSVWGSLGRISNGSPNETQNLPKDEYYYNLSSFVTENGYNYINIQQNPGDLDGNLSININTVRMIEELNCPLYGLNPRGRYLNYTLTTESGYIQPASLTTPQASFINLPGYIYANADDYANTFYYQSSNIGGRFGTLSPSLATDVVNEDGINYQNHSTVGSGRSSRIGYISKARRVANRTNNAKYARTYGYTDFGHCTVCRTITSETDIYYKQYDESDTDNILSIGYYPLNASLNRFANTFINRRLYSYSEFIGNIDTAENLIPYGFSNPGHPLTVDYETNIETVTSDFPVASQNDFFRYDPVNPYNNSANGDNVKRTPIYKTRHSSIICDTGAIDYYGNYIPDYNFEPSVQNGNIPKIFARKRKVLGAINNPWYGSSEGRAQNGGVGPEQAETIVSKTATGIKLCVKLKNYRDYILTDDQIPVLFNDSYESLMDSSNPRNKRVLNYKNSLRIVVFTNPYNSFTDDLTFGGPGPGAYTDLSSAAGSYAGRMYYDNRFLLNPNTIKYGCTNSSCSCASDELNEGTCNSCHINELDKQTNAYGASNLENVVCTILGGADTQFDAACVGCISSIRGEYGVGGNRSLGSLLRCTCNPPAPIECPPFNGTNNISSLFNCRNCDHQIPCSCKTSSLNKNYDSAGGVVSCPAIEECPFCRDCSNPPPGAIQPPFGCLLLRPCGSCPTGCNLFQRFGAETSGGAIIEAIKFVQNFFAQFGYLQNQDYWFADNATSAYPMVVWKLFPSVKTISGIPVERYNFPLLSPPQYMVSQSGNEPPYYYRNTICGPNGTSTDPISIQNCGLNSPINAGVICTNFCELGREVCTPSVEALSGTITSALQQFIQNINDHGRDSDDDGLFEPEQNILSTIAAPCTNAANLLTGLAYKKVYISEDQFICVNMDCSSIDCTQFEDCPS